MKRQTAPMWQRLCVSVTWLFSSCAYQAHQHHAHNSGPEVRAANDGKLEAKEYDFFVRGGGRPENAFVLRFASDAGVCKQFLTAMNEARAYSPDNRGDDLNWRANDIFLGSRFIVPWMADAGTNLRYTQVDINNDGKIDSVYHETSTVAGNDFDTLYYGPLDPHDKDSISASFQRLMNQTRQADQPPIPYELVLNDQTIDAASVPLPASRSDWMLGQFKNVVVFGGKSYAVAGGNWQRLVGRDWFPVLLIDVKGHSAQRLVCELFPKYRQRFGGGQ